MRIMQKILVQLCSKKIVKPKIRQKILNRCIGKVGSTMEISHSCFFYGNQIEIGEESFINCFCQFLSQNDREDAKIVIDNNVRIAMNVTLCTHTHKIGNSSYRASMPNSYKPIKIESGCWIGANAFIGPGVTIESGCVIAAGAVVISDCEKNGLYAGVPAKCIRRLND